MLFCDSQDPTGAGMFSKVGRYTRPNAMQKNLLEKLANKGSRENKNHENELKKTLQEKLLVKRIGEDSDDEFERKTDKRCQTASEVQRSNQNNVSVKREQYGHSGTICLKEKSQTLSDKYQKKYNEMCPFEKQTNRASFVRDPDQYSYFKPPDLRKYEPEKQRSHSVLVGDIKKCFKSETKNKLQSEMIKQNKFEKNKKSCHPIGSSNGPEIHKYIYKKKFCFVNMNQCPSREQIQAMYNTSTLNEKRYSIYQNLNPNSWSKNRHKLVIDISKNMGRIEKQIELAPEPQYKINYDFGKRRISGGISFDKQIKRKSMHDIQINTLDFENNFEGVQNLTEKMKKKYTKIKGAEEKQRLFQQFQQQMKQSFQAKNRSYSNCTSPQRPQSAITTIMNGSNGFKSKQNHTDQISQLIQLQKASQTLPIHPHSIIGQQSEEEQQDNIYGGNIKEYFNKLQCTNYYLGHLNMEQ